MRVARIRTAAGDRYAVAQIGTDGAPEWAVVEDPFADEVLYTGERVPVEGTTLLAPSVPRVVVGIAHNKANNDHHLPIQVWTKSARSIAGPHDEIPFPDNIGGINIEGELAVVIGKSAYRLTLENALDAVFGYTITNDVTNVDQVAIDEKFFQVKSGVNYAPIGPWVETDIANPDDVPITVAINGVVLAESGTKNLPSTIAECLVYVTQWLELGPGDIVISGAPRTFFPAKPGDVVEITLPGIGTLTNTIVAEAAA
ncbi:MAG: fumarylacetoacetate hydrolase family protein [Salinibacterium sp.]|nr:fumarylacetoacetate hydrolase family protein [Salinibacterium sp.]